MKVLTVQEIRGFPKKEGNPHFYKFCVHIHPMNRVHEKLTTIDYITLAFILFQTIILILNWNLLPSAELDTPYHLLMGKMFSDYDTVMLWDYYEYAPAGRPNLYPPLEHVLLWWMHDLSGADWWSIGRFISLIQYPLPLVAVWFFSKKLFNPVTALASVVFLSVSQDFWFWQVSVAPTALIISLVPLFLYSFYQKKVLLSILLLTSFLYLHLGLPYVVILATFMFSLLSLYQTKDYVKQFALVTGVSLLLFLPWAVHVLMYRDWISSGPPGFFNVFSLFTGVNILVAVFFVLGILKCVENAKIDLRYLLVLSAFVGFLAVIVYGWRYKMHSPIVNCVVTGIGFEMVYARILSSTSQKKVAAIVLLLLIPLGAFSLNAGSSMLQQPQPPQPPCQQPQNLPLLPGQPQSGQPQIPQVPGQFPPGQQLNPPQPLSDQPQKPGQPPRSQLQSRTLQIHLQPSPLIDMLISLKTGKRPQRMWQITNPQIGDLITWIQANTSPDEILHVENGMLADYLALFTDRRTDAGMYREVTSPELFQSIREGKKSGIFVIEEGRFREQSAPLGMTLLARFGNLLVLQGMKSQPIPQEIPLHLTDLFILIEHPTPQTVTQWTKTIKEVNPQRVYLGIFQRDLENPSVKQLIAELTPVCEVGLSIIVEEKIQPIKPPAGVVSVRLVIPPDRISFNFIQSVRNSLDPRINLEIALLGPPITGNRGIIESLLQVYPLVDRVVRHVPPNVEFINVAREESLPFKEKFYIQIDTARGQAELTPEELFMLLQAASQVTRDKVIIEFSYLPNPQMLRILKEVYRH